VSDVMGRVIAFSGRALPDPTPEELAALKISGPTTTPDQAPAKYINSPESPIYTKGEHLFGLHQARQAIRQGGEAILVEGNFDVVALHARGIGNVVAPLGTAFTPAQAKLLKRFAPSVIVFFDGDNAGRKATRAARGPCREGGLDAKVAVLPKGADPDDFVQKHGTEALARLLKNARGMLEYALEDALDSEAFRSGSLEEQRARVRAVTHILSEERDPNLRAMVKTYADRLSSKLLVGGQPLASLRELESAVEQALATGTRAAPPLPTSQASVTHDRARSRTQYEEIALSMLGALLDYPVLLDDPEVQVALESLDGDHALAVAALRQTMAQVAAHRARSTSEQATTVPDPGAAPDAGGEAGSLPNRANPGIEIGVYADEFLAQIRGAIHSFAAERLAAPVFDAAEEAKRVLVDNARKLQSLSLKRENAAEIEQLQRATAQGDAATEDDLLRAAILRAQKRHGLK